LSAEQSSAQSLRPQFNRWLYDCEDQYVLLPSSDPDSTYSCVFVYIDRSAGFSLRHMTTVGVSPMGFVYNAKSALDTSQYTVTVRIPERDKRRVALLSPAIVKQLGLPAESDLVAVYRDKDSIADAALRAYHYNHVDQSRTALKILSPLYSSLVANQSFLFEYIFALNATGKFDTACAVCRSAVETFSKDISILKEYGYCLTSLQRFDEAVAIMEKTIDLCGTSDQEREIAAECCVNIAVIKRDKGDLEAARTWIERAKAVVPESSRLAKQLKRF
jgi:Flp pilus assembly protein TadD